MMFVNYVMILVFSLFIISIPSVFADTIFVDIPTGTAVPGCEETNSCFIPNNIEVTVGDTVVWQNKDSAGHTVTSGTASEGPDGTFDSGLLCSACASEEFPHEFNQVGKYDYYCMLHPWMAGTVTVNSLDSGVNNVLTVSNVGMFDSFSNPITKILLGDSVRISTDVSNGNAFGVPFMVLAKFESEHGTSNELGMGGTELEAGQSFNVGVNWMPEHRGKHIITIMVVNNIAEKKLLAEPVSFSVTVTDPTLPDLKEISISEGGIVYDVNIYTDATLIYSNFDEDLKKLTLNLEKTSSDPWLIVEIPRYMLDDIYDVLHDGTPVLFSLETTPTKNIVTIKDSFNDETSILGKEHWPKKPLFGGYILSYWWDTGFDSNQKISKDMENKLDLQFHRNGMSEVKSRFKVSVFPETAIIGKEFESTAFGFQTIELDKNTFKQGTEDNPGPYDVYVDVDKINGKSESRNNSARISVAVVPEFSSISVMIILTVMVTSLIIFAKTQSGITLMRV